MPPSNRDTNQWYVLTYTHTLATAVQRLSAVSGLEFYAPEFELDQEGRNRRESWYFHNYAFVFASQNVIYELKKCELKNFSFMRNRADADNIQHPFVSAFEIEQLKKVEKMNDGKIPLTLSTEDIIVGDKIEILTGEFKGHEATAITKERSKFRQIYLFIGNFLTIPLCQLKEEEFKIIQYANPSKKKSEFGLSLESTTAITDAIKRFYGLLTSDDEKNEIDCREIAKLKALCEKNQSLSLNNRVKALSLLGLAYMLSGENEKSLRYLKFANAMLQEKVTMVARLYYATMRYLSTSLPNHYSDFKILEKEVHRSLSQGSSLIQFINCAEELNKYLTKHVARNSSGDIFPGGLNQDYWFCLSAPKRKTEATKLFRDKNIPIFAPIVSDDKNKDQKNVFKDIFFVKTKYENLLKIRDEHPLFTILTQTVDNRSQILIYSDEEKETFDYVNSLDIPNKEILKYTPQHEVSVCRSHRKTLTLGERELEGHLMTLHIGKKTQQKVLFLLRGVATIAVSLE